MSDINFIPNQNSNIDDNDGLGRGKDEQEISWTKPDSDKKDDETHKKEIIENKEVNRSDSEKNKLPENKPGNKPQAKKEIDKKTGKVGLLGRLKNIFRGQRPEKKQVSDFKNNKEVLVDYQEVFKKEKLKRSGDIKQGNLNISSDKIYTTPAAIETKTELKKIKIKSLKDIVGIITSFGKNSIATSNTLKTNLIQGDVTTFFDWKKHLKIVLLYIFFAGSLVSLVYIGLDYWEGSISERGVALINDIEKIIPEIESAEEKADEVDVFQRKLNLASLLLDKHIYWTNLFKFLEEHTIQDVSYNAEFSGGINGNYTLESTAGSYGMMADQIKVFESSDLVTEAKVETARLTKSAKSSEDGKVTEISVGVAYNLSLKIKPDIFYK